MSQHVTYNHIKLLPVANYHQSKNIITVYDLISLKVVVKWGGGVIKISRKVGWGWDWFIRIL